jgi:type IV secretory pathway VirB2 component (pilin)
MRLTEHLSPVAAALAALPAMACCIPLGLAGAAGVLALGEMFQTAQTWFLGAAANTRVILLVSHTCPYGLRGAADFQQILARHASAPLTVFAVWGPILPTHWGRPASAPLRRLYDPRVRQYWDPGRPMARELLWATQAGGPQPDCC